MYITTVKEETDQLNDQFKELCPCTKSMLVCCYKK